MVTKMRGLSIGQLAHAAGVNLETIRYYERIGLVAAPNRSQKGHRSYDASAVKELTFVRRARELGFGISDIRTLLMLAASDYDSCASIKEIATTHLTGVQSKIADLAKLENILRQTIGQCGGQQSPHCPVLDMLETGVP